MTLPASGFGIVDIIGEIFNLSGGKDLGQCIAASNPAVAGGSEPGSVLDFASHTQVWGRVYGQEDISFDVWAWALDEGYNAFGGSETFLWTSAVTPESVILYKSGTGTKIFSSDAIRIELYYRTAGSSGSWNFSVGWDAYDTDADGPHSLTTSLYDYKFIVTSI